MHWPHAPVHWAFDAGSYMITAGTHQKSLLFDSPAKLDLLQTVLFETAAEFHWSLEAWAVLANHYHVVARSPEDPATLSAWMRKLHACSARELNRLDSAAGRKVWFQYWDTHLTHQTSHLARLAYVHRNPSRHGLVRDARQYRWCSASWFEQNAPVSFVQTVRAVPTDTVNVIDDF